MGNLLASRSGGAAVLAAGKGWVLAMLPVLPAKQRVRAGPRGSGPGAKRRRPCPPLRAAAARGRRDEGRPAASTPKRACRPGVEQRADRKGAGRGRTASPSHPAARHGPQSRREGVPGRSREVGGSLAHPGSHRAVSGLPSCGRLQSSGVVLVACADPGRPGCGPLAIPSEA